MALRCAVVRRTIKVGRPTRLSGDGGAISGNNGASQVILAASAPSSRRGGVDDDSPAPPHQAVVSPGLLGPNTPGHCPSPAGLCDPGWGTVTWPVAPWGTVLHPQGLGTAPAGRGMGVSCSTASRWDNEVHGSKGQR